MALDKDTGSTLFGNIKKTIPQLEEEIGTQQNEIPLVEKQSKARWEKLDKVTVLLTTEQKEGLDRIAKKLMKHRSKELKGNDSKERITANTIIRGLIDNFLTKEEFQKVTTLSTEKDVHEWIKECLKI